MADSGDTRLRLGAALMIALGLGSAVPSRARARVQTYQIVRLINYKSNCQLSKLEDRSPAKGPMRFLAQCENVSFYPDGVEIQCDDPDDDRSCRLLTAEKRFDQLDLLRPDHKP